MAKRDGDFYFSHRVTTYGNGEALQVFCESLQEKEELTLEEKIYAQAYQKAKENILYVLLNEQDYICYQLAKKGYTYKSIAKTLGYNPEGSTINMRMKRLKVKINNITNKIKTKSQTDLVVSNIEEQINDSKIDSNNIPISFEIDFTSKMVKGKHLIVNNELMIDVEQIMRATGIINKDELLKLIKERLNYEGDSPEYVIDKKKGKVYVSYVGCYLILKNTNVDIHSVDSLFKEEM